MADYPFNLRGERVRSNGPGQRGGETYKSREFTLKPGIVYAEIEHHGHGDFTLEFVPTEGFTRGEATTATIGGSFATSARGRYRNRCCHRQYCTRRRNNRRCRSRRSGRLVRRRQSR